MSAIRPTLREHTRQRLRILLCLWLLSASIGMRVSGNIVQAANAIDVTVDSTTARGVLPSTAFGLNEAVWDGDLRDSVVPNLYQQAGVTLLRYPGGSTSDVYHWQSNTLTRPGPGIYGSYANPNNTFDAFMDVAHRSGAQPLVTVNYGSNAAGTGGGDPAEAAAWVRYANVTKGYGTMYWEVGNETYGGWETNLWPDKSPTAYATNARAFIDQMKAVAPSIKVGIPVWTDDNGFSGWNRTVLPALCPTIDFLDVHFYPETPGQESDAGLLASTGRIAMIMATLRADIARYCGNNAAHVRIIVGESNSVSYAPGKQTMSVVSGLFLADNDMTWLEQGATSVAWWAAHNGNSVGGNNDPALYGTAAYGDQGMLSYGTCAGGLCEPSANTPFPTYEALHMLAHLGRPGDTMVGASSSTSAVAVHAVKRADGSLALLLINKDPNASYNVSVTLNGYMAADTGTVYTYGIGSTATTSEQVSGIGGNTFTRNIAPYSLTTVVLAPAPQATVTLPASTTPSSVLPAASTNTPMAPTLTATVSALSALSATPRANTPTPLAARSYFWGLIKDDGTHLTDERAAGIGVKVIRISWKDFYPHEGVPDPAYITATQGQFDRLRTAGFGIILELGIQDTPSWLHATYPNASYVDQYGDVYSGNGQPDSGDANAIFNPTVHTLLARYMHDVFAAFGTDFYAVRLGGGHWGELTYPTASYNGHTNCYWAYDANARAQSPTPGWIPGQDSPHGEAVSFANWYLNRLVDYQNWQITTLRQNYGGPIMMLYPGWGIRPGQLDRAVAGNLGGSTSPEINGEVQTGTDYARQIAAITDTNTIVYTTWLDAPFGDDASANPDDWRPVHYLVSLAAAHRPALRVAGENTGQGSPSQLRFAAAQMKAYGLAGMVWCQESELYSGQYATIGDYRDTIAAGTPIASPAASAIAPSSTPTGASTATSSTPSATATSTAHPSPATQTTSPTATRSPSRTPSATSTAPSAPTITNTPTTVIEGTSTPPSLPVPARTTTSAPTATRVAMSPPATTTATATPVATNTLTSSRPTIISSSVPTIISSSVPTIISSSVPTMTSSPSATRPVAATATSLSVASTALSTTQSPPPVTALTRTDTPVPPTAIAPIPPLMAPVGATSTAPAIPGSTPTILARPIAALPGVTRPVASATSVATATRTPTTLRNGRGNRKEQVAFASRETGPPMTFERTSASAAIVAPGKVETFTSVIKAGRPIHNVVVDFAVYDAVSRRVWHAQRHHITFVRLVATHISILWRIPRSQPQGTYALKLSVLDALPTARVGNDHAAIFRIALPHRDVSTRHGQFTVHTGSFHIVFGA
jgi:hypothetical protein